jgi:hypothetical protein
MQNALHLINVWDNPVFHRFRRSQLRAKKAIFWYLATLIITTFVVTLTYLIETNFTQLPANATQEAIAQLEEQAARNLWIPLLVIQGLILLLKGTGRTSAGLIQDKIDETLDYQRLTPVSPLRNVVGYVFGLPILEYAMFALTLPHLAFIVVKGNIPLAPVLSVYLVFFTCAIFYHMTAVAVGMVIKRWIWGYLLSLVSVAFLNMILPTVASQLGLKFLQYLSIIPVIGQKVLPLMAPTRQFVGPGPAPFAPPNQFNQPGQFGGPQQFGGPPPGFEQSGEASFFSFADPVPFFDWTLSPFVFTLLLQFMLIVTLATMAVRRWQKATKHSLSKPYALGILAMFILLLTGNLWPAITGEALPFALFGTREINEISSTVVAIGLPLVYSIAIWLLCLFLFANVVPTHHDYVRGVRRAKKLNRSAALPWDDDSANLPFMTSFIAVALLGFWVLYGQISNSGYLSFLDGTGYSHWRLPLLLGLVLLYTLLVLQVLQMRGMVLTFLLLWLLPILVAIVSAAAIEDVTPFQTVVASLSPLATMIMTGMLPSGWVDAFDAADSEFRTIMTGATTGVVFLLVQIALLSFRWRQLKLRLQ